MGDVGIMFNYRSFQFSRLAPRERQFVQTLTGEGIISMLHYNSVSLVVAIAVNETLAEYGVDEACNVVSGDDGHGIMQLTSSWPVNWRDPVVSVKYAVDHFLNPATDYWVAQTTDENAIVRCVAATYNEGLGAAIRYHARGDVDLGTANEYGARAWATYARITGLA